MERVTNVFCGGSGSVAYVNLQSANNANATPEKPSRSAAQTINNVPAGNNKERLNNVTPSRTRIPRNRMKIAVPLASGGTGGYVPPTTWEQLVQDDNFLGRFFLYFNATERRILAQVRDERTKKNFLFQYTIFNFPTLITLCIDPIVEYLYHDTLSLLSHSLSTFEMYV